MDAIYIVTIERNIDRARRAQRMMADMGITATIHIGVDGDGLTPAKYTNGEGYSSSLNRIHWSVPLSESEIGCYLSHYRLWHHAVDAGHRRIVVFEDDVLPLPNFGDAIRRLVEAEERHEYIDLAPSADAYSKPAIDNIFETYMRIGENISEGVRLLPAVVPPWSTHAYSVSSSGLRKLCDGRMMPIKQALDGELRSQTVNGAIKRYIILPGVVAVAPSGSNVIRRTHAKSHRFLRKRWRLYNLAFRRADMRRYYVNRQAFKRQMSEYTATMLRDIKAKE